MTNSLTHNIDYIIAVSNEILLLLDTVNENKPEDETTPPQDSLSNLIAVRDRLLHQLFDENMPDKLFEHMERLREIKAVDKKIIDKVHSQHKDAKDKVLAFKKKSKAINSYNKN